MKYPLQFVLEVSDDDVYRAFVFGDSPLQFALRRRHGILPNARVGEFLLSMGDGWTYRTPIVAQRFILRHSKGVFVRGRTFTFENPFYIDPALAKVRPIERPARKKRARKERVARG